MMTRREKARVAAGRVADRVREVTPEGLGRWDRTWGFVAVSSDAFMDALAEWETEDTPTTRTELEATAAAFIGAWAQAGREWEAAGRPTHDEPEAVPA